MIAPRPRATSWTELLAEWLGCPPGAVSETQAMDFRGLVMDEVTFTDDVGWPKALVPRGWSFPSDLSGLAVHECVYCGETWAVHCGECSACPGQHAGWCSKEPGNVEHERRGGRR